MFTGKILYIFIPCKQYSFFIKNRGIIVDQKHIYLVKVINWSKINNKRKDVKLSTWFKLKHDFFYDEKMFDLTHEEKLFWIYILCECSKQLASPQNTDYITVNTKLAHRIANFDEKSVHRMLLKLKQLRILEIRTLRGRYVDVTLDRDREENRIEERENEIENEIENISKGGKENAPPLGNNKKLNSETWEAYKNSYYQRYKTEPVRNATVNGQISNLVKRLGKESPDVVKFYLEQNRAFYIQSCHPVGLCLKDAEALRTQWASNFSVNPIAAKQAEQRQHNENVWDRAFENLKKEKKNL